MTAISISTVHHCKKIKRLGSYLIINLTVFVHANILCPTSFSVVEIKILFFEIMRIKSLKD